MKHLRLITEPASCACIPAVGIPVLALLCLAPLTVRADQPEFAFTRAVEALEREQNELLSVMLDSGVYAATQDGMHDVRVRTTDGQSVPFIIRQVMIQPTRSVRRTWSPHAMTARPLDDGGLEILVHLDDDAPTPGGLTLETPLRDFEKQVRVETSPDGSDWQPAAETLIFDYSRFINVRQDDIPLPASPHRHLRIVIKNVTEAQESELLELTRRIRGDNEAERFENTTIRRRPFRINRVQLWSDVEQPGPPTGKRITYPPVDVQISRDDESQQTLILVRTRREPVNRFVIETPDRNFSRQAMVQVEEVSGAERRWRTIGEATLTRIDFKDLQREQLAITFPRTRGEQYRVVIEQGDGLPIEITTVTMSGDAHEVVFLASAESDYRLDYGNPHAEPADIDTTTLEELLREDYVPLSAALGPEVAAATLPHPDPDRWSKLFNNTPLLVGIIAVLVVLLALGLARAAKRIDVSEEPQ